MRTITILLISNLLLINCNTSSFEETSTITLASNTTIEKKPITVKVQPIEVGTFPLQTTTNGTLQARQKLEIKLEMGGKIIELPLREGQAVKKGELLLQLDDQALQLQLEQYQLALEEAEVNKADLLIANGGQAFVDTSVSAQKLKLVNTLSGYNKSKHAIKQAEHELSKVNIHAPFSGIIADVKVQAEQQVSGGETVCTLLDPNSFEAVFTLLEQDATRVKKGESVKIFPLSLPEQTLTGRITAINPIVDEQGLVTVYARLNNSRRSLFEGMNVKVVIERPVYQQLIVPKSAVVLRSGKAVVFTYEEPLAKWNYVTVAHENDVSAAISEGLSKTDTIIYIGNLNLDHDAQVVLREED
ncbi:MAG: efflux RND transporter periplasmic adaptor subunit [Bacteroidota bacterium]